MAQDHEVKFASKIGDQKFGDWLLKGALTEFLFGTLLMGVALTIVSVFDFAAAIKISVMIAVGVAFLGAVISDAGSSVSAQIFSSTNHALQVLATFEQAAR